MQEGAILRTVLSVDGQVQDATLRGAVHRVVIVVLLVWGMLLSASIAIPFATGIVGLHMLAILIVTLVQLIRIRQ